jgi:hypothetical protein
MAWGFFFSWADGFSLYFFLLKRFFIAVVYSFPTLYFYAGTGLLNVRGNFSCDCSSCFFAMNVLGRSISLTGMEWV